MRLSLLACLIPSPPPFPLPPTHNRPNSFVVSTTHRVLMAASFIFIFPFILDVLRQKGRGTHRKLEGDFLFDHISCGLFFFLLFLFSFFNVDIFSLLTATNMQIFLSICMSARRYSSFSLNILPNHFFIIVHSFFWVLIFSKNKHFETL